jgi:hypothetical protein
MYHIHITVEAMISKNGLLTIIILLELNWQCNIYLINATQFIDMFKTYPLVQHSVCSKLCKYIILICMKKTQFQDV